MSLATVLGLHPLDAAIIAGFLLVLLAIGVVVSHSVRKQSDFFLGGRKLGRTLQFFLNFGNSTDAAQSTILATAVYERGAIGIWEAGFQALFITPFFWFTQPWWRRARVTTMADLFVERFNSKAVASAYAAFNTVMAVMWIAMGNFSTYQVAHAMIVKPPAQYSANERTQVDQFHEYEQLKSRIASGDAAVASSERFKFLDSEYKQGKLASFISYVRPVPFYVGYSAIVGIYIALGGLKAAALTDAIQGLLILVMSVLMIPIGFHQLGASAGGGILAGLHELHQRVPETFFRFGANVPFIIATSFASLIQIIGLMHNMSTAGSAVNEDAARFGMISGGFTKRLVLVGWTVCGLLAVAILSGPLQLSDPNNAWGALSLHLLVPGLLGLMLSGMLLGHMPSVGVYAVSVAGLVTRNLYAPVFRGKSEQHYLRVGQWAIPAVLVAAILVAIGFSNVVSAYTMLVTFNTFFGAAVVLTLFWRRQTGTAIVIGIVVWVVLMGIIPYALPMVRSFRQHESLLVQTEPTYEVVDTAANSADVAAGRAQRLGQIVKSRRAVAPVSVYFENVARAEPTNPHSPLEGVGRFNVENYCLHLLGAPVRRFSAGTMSTVRWGFDGLFPFVLLMVLSFCTPAEELERGDRLFAKMRTPVAPTPEADAAQVQASYENPHRFDDRKIWRRSDWQFAKWQPRDVVGFFGCWGIAFAILGVLWLVLHVGG